MVKWLGSLKILPRVIAESETSKTRVLAVGGAVCGAHSR